MKVYLTLAFLLVALFSLGLVPRPAVANALSVSLTRLTQDATVQTAPAIALTSNGAIAVAWEEKVPRGKVMDWDVFVDTAPAGQPFGGPVNFSNDLSSARSPYLFQSQNGVYMLYRDTLKGTSNFKVLGTEWDGSTWASPARVDHANFMDAQDPIGVQLPGGAIWFTWQAWEGWTWTDTIAQTVGGDFVNVSNDGSAVKHPAIAYGDGNLYIAWVDHANERVRRMSPGVHVAQYDGTTWTQLPVVTTEYLAAYPSLAYFNHNLYLVWRSSSPVSIKSSVWNGSTWGPITKLAVGNGATTPTIFIPASGNVFVTWEQAGVIYLKENSNAPVVVSTGAPKSHQPALFVDGTDTAHIAFQNGDVWYAEVTP